MRRLDNAVVMVTGASAGVGRATIRELAKHGARIGLIARNAEALECARHEAKELGGQAMVLPLDVCDPDAVERAATSLEERFGPIEIWINNAMVSVFSPVSEMRPEEYKRVTEVTYLGYVYGTLAALPRMKKRNDGVIVQVSSALAFRSIPLQSAYCAAKHAIKGFTESLISELIHDGSAVQVSMVHMPALNTPQFGWSRTRLPNAPQPVPPIFQPEVAARAIVYAAQHAPRDLKVGYPTLEAIVGEKFVPAYIDRRLAYTGYEAQQTDEPVQEPRIDNLWHPVPGDHGAHGTFDHRSRAHSPLLWFDMHKKELAIAWAGIVSALALWNGWRTARRI